MLAVYTFLHRAHNYSKKTWDEIDDKISFNHLHFLFYKYVEDLFGDTAVSYNYHNFVHMPQYVIENGPLYDVSAEKYEDLYGVCKNFFVPGTKNAAKQIMQQFLFHEITKHHCKNTKGMFICPNVTNQADDSLLLTGDGFFKVLECETEPAKESEERRNKWRRSRNFKCSPVSVTRIDTRHIGINLPWHLVGVFTLGNVKEETVMLQRKDVIGKGVVVDDYIIEFRKEWMNL